MNLLGGILLGVATLLAGSARSAPIFYVDRDFQGENPSGDSWLNAFPSLHEAIDAASGGGEIWVKAGVYKPKSPPRAATFELPPGIALYGGFRGTETTRAQRNPKAYRTRLSGDIGQTGSLTNHGLHIATVTAGCRIDGFILSGGYADGAGCHGHGAALLIDHNATNVTVANCTFEKNHAILGGAIHTSATGTTLSNCTFYSNSADSGGAIHLGDGAEIQIDACKFTSNFAQEAGGAIAIRAPSKINISHSWFLFNHTKGTGGAIDGSTKNTDKITLTLAHCEFNENSATQNGGGLFSQGAVVSDLTHCRFIHNLSEQGTGAIASQDGATFSFLNGTLKRNQSAKGFTAVTSSTVAKTPIPTPVEQLKPVPDVAPKFLLADPTLHQTPNRRVPLQRLLAQNRYTVLAFGDLTHPEFITSYRGIEAAARDYSKKGVRFFYIHSYLTHPENNSYVQSVTLGERFQHILAAKRVLHTRIPWLCDGMENPVAVALERGINTLFIYHQDGQKEYAGTLADAEGFRKALVGLAGEIAAPCSIDSFSSPDIAPIQPPDARFVKRIKGNPAKDAFLTLQATSLKSRSPLYVKLRAEASDTLLKTGNGKLYLGFHIDPLYQAKWNNLASPLKYTIKVPGQTAISPSSHQATKITRQPTDSGPREFLLAVRKWDPANPIAVTITYSILSSRANRIVEVSQRYILHLKHDPFGGSVIGRQMPGDEKEKSPPAYTILLFKHFDADQDGMLSRTEAPASLLKKWDDIDVNRDGLLTEEEYRRHRKSL